MMSYIKGAIGFLGFFGIIIGYTIQRSHLGSHLDLAALIKTGVIVGTVVGVALGVLLYRSGKNQDARYSIFVGMIVLGAITGPLLCTIINRITSSDPIPIRYELISIKPVMHSNIGVIKGAAFEPDAHLITIMKDGDSYDLSIGPDLDQYVINSESITLDVQNGGLGFDYVVD